MINEKIKDHGKREVRQRNALKSQIKSLSALLGRIMNDMPKADLHGLELKKKEESEDEVMIRVPKISVRERGKKASLNQELLNIKKRLASFS